MSKYQDLHEKEYILPDSEDLLIDAKTVLLVVYSYVSAHDSRSDLSDWTTKSKVDAPDKAAYIESEKARALEAIQEFHEQDETLSNEFGVLMEAIIALVSEGKLVEAGHLVQVPISQIRKKLPYGDMGDDVR